MFNTLFEEGYAPASCQRWKSLNSSSAKLALVFRLAISSLKPACRLVPPLRPPQIKMQQKRPGSLPDLSCLLKIKD